MKTTKLNPFDIAQTCLARIKAATDPVERQSLAQEWYSIYASFSPEEKKEVQPILNKISESALKIIAEADALIAEHLRKYPESAHLFKEA